MPSRPGANDPRHHGRAECRRGRRRPARSALARHVTVPWRTESTSRAARPGGSGRPTVTAGPKVVRRSSTATAGEIAGREPQTTRSSTPRRGGLGARRRCGAQTRMRARSIAGRPDHRRPRGGLGAGCRWLQRSGPGPDLAGLGRHPVRPPLADGRGADLGQLARAPRAGARRARATAASARSAGRRELGQRRPHGLRREVDAGVVELLPLVGPDDRRRRRPRRCRTRAAGRARRRPATAATRRRAPGRPPRSARRRPAWSSLARATTRDRRSGSRPDRRWLRAASAMPRSAIVNGSKLPGRRPVRPSDLSPRCRRCASGELAEPPSALRLTALRPPGIDADRCPATTSS